MLSTFYHNPKTFFVLLISFFTAFYWIFPDIMPFNQGFAFEGYTIYKPLAKDVYEYLITNRMNSYSIQRIFPYVLLNLIFKIFNINFTDSNMILFFQFFQFVVAIITIYVWDKLANTLKIKLPGQWIGYLSLLINFSTLKLDFYIPFTYDRLAMASGLISFYYYFTNRPLGLFINTIFALTIWPTALLFNLLMLMIPVTETVPKTRNVALSWIWALSVAGAVCGLFILIIYIKHIPNPQHLAPAVHSLLPLSILIIGGYLTYTQVTLAQNIFPKWSELVPRIIHLLRPNVSWLYALAVIATYLLLTRYLGDPSHPYLTPQQFAINLTYGALQRPAQSLVFHILYYGLPFAFIALFWRRALQGVTQLGLGTGLLFMAIIIQAVNNETRQMANVIPLLTVLAAIIADGLNPRPVVVAITAIIATVLSKGWVVSLNYFDPNYGEPGDIYPMLNFEKGSFLEWPQQAYFMNFGPWAATPYLIMQTVAVVLILLLLYIIWNKKHLVTEA